MIFISFEEVPDDEALELVDDELFLLVTDALDDDLADEVFVADAFEDDFEVVVPSVAEPELTLEFSLVENDDCADPDVILSIVLSEEV